MFHIYNENISSVMKKYEVPITYEVYKEWVSEHTEHKLRTRSYFLNDIRLTLEENLTAEEKLIQIKCILDRDYLNAIPLYDLLK